METLFPFPVKQDASGDELAAARVANTLGLHTTVYEVQRVSLDVLSMRTNVVGRGGVFKFSTLRRSPKAFA